MKALNKICSIVGLSLFMAAQPSHAFECSGKTAYGPIKVKISGNVAKVSGSGLSTIKTISNLQHEYDGHMTGIYTGTGISLKYENHYGCIRNVVIITNIADRGATNLISEIRVSLCKGGTTPDRLCRGN